MWRSFLNQDGYRVACMIDAYLLSERLIDGTQSVCSPSDLKSVETLIQHQIERRRIMTRRNIEWVATEPHAAARDTLIAVTCRLRCKARAFLMPLCSFIGQKSSYESVSLDMSEANGVGE
jgi:hypothetical protein